MNNTVKCYNNFLINSDDDDEDNDDDDNDDDDDYDNTKYAKCDTKINLSKINLSNKSHQTHHNKVLTQKN